MATSGDARLLSWGLYLETSSSVHRIRFLCCFDIQNEKLHLINSEHQPSIYDFWCISGCVLSKKDKSLLSLQLDNTKQSYKVKLYLDSALDRDSIHQLFRAVMKQNIVPIAARLGWTADLEIGVQAHRIQRGYKDSSPKRAHWQPRILSLVQNRILLFRDKSRDFHPVEMLSLSTTSFTLYRVELYEHTVQMHCSKQLVFQFHLGDDNALHSLTESIRSALTKYNPNALVWCPCHCHIVPLFLLYPPSL